MGKLDGRVAFITGGARGQGRSHAVTFADEGADIIVCDIAAQIATAPYPMPRPDDLEHTAKLIEERGRRCLAIQADVRVTAEIESAVARAINEFGKIDVLIANAGICGFGKFWEISDNMWDDMIATDLTGVFKTMRAVVPHMIERGSGRIIATSSMGGRMGNPNLAHYVAAKWGVIGLVKTLAVEVAKNGITVNAVCPSAVDTDMVHNDAFYGLFCPDLENPTRTDVEPRYTAMNQIPVPWIDPAEISRAMLFLASDDARYITGSTMDVDCGATALMP
jgi:SDR family mycofactocin-dependent oxidoreductase